MNVPESLCPPKAPPDQWGGHTGGRENTLLDFSSHQSRGMNVSPELVMYPHRPIILGEWKENIASKDVQTSLPTSEGLYSSVSTDKENYLERSIPCSVLLARLGGRWAALNSEFRCWIVTTACVYSVDNIDSMWGKNSTVLSWRVVDFMIIFRPYTDVS